MWLSRRGLLYDAWGRQRHMCATCGTLIDARDLEEHMLSRDDTIVVCADCVEQEPEPTGSGKIISS